MLAPLVLAAALFDPVTGAKTVDRGILSTPLTGELSQAARTWALSRRSELGLPPDSTLVNGPSFGTRFGASFHLQQQVEGVDVYGANAVVTIDKSSRVVLLTSSLVSYREARKGWLIGEAEALLRAARQVPMPALQADGTPYGAAKKAFFQVGEDVHAGWLVHVPTVDVTKNLYLAIDATTGQTLQVWNRVFNAALDANAYRISPGGLDAGVGVTPTITVSLTQADGGSMLSPDAGGVLVGNHVDGFNCCVIKDCDPGAPDAGASRAKGTTMFQFMGFPLTVKYDVVSCDFKHQASNDVLKHAAGSFEYPPLDPPLTGAFQLTDPAASDEFSEVHSFYQVNRLYDWVSGLSRTAAPLFPANQPAIGPFSMRDERRVPARKPAIWANFVFPNFNEIFANLGCIGDMDAGCVINSYTRLDNAAFVAVENFAQIPLPSYRNDVDTLMMFQGDKADFSYDSTVIWHEFGHGVVYATANLGLDRLAIDNRSANNESGALHEGFADFIAGAYGGDPDMGRYVGPRVGGAANGMTGIRTEQFLRTLNNTLTCPDVLHGEVHDDSQHVSAALWRARQDHFQGTDDGGTFDATFYAMLVSLSATADFAQVAAVMTSHVNTAFPDGGTALTDIFNQKGVTNCIKVIDMTGAQPRERYGIGARAQSSLTSGYIPGPHQMKIRTPNGAQSVTVTAQVGSDPLGLGGGAPRLKALARVGGPLTFTRAGASLVADAQATVDVVIPQGSSNASAVIPISAPCGATSEVYVTVANDGTGPATLGNLALTVQPPASCNAMDGGMDGGTDGGMTVVTPGITKDGGPQDIFEGPARNGCGCGASGAAAPFVLLFALALRRRRRS